MISTVGLWRFAGTRPDVWDVLWSVVVVLVLLGVALVFIADALTEKTTSARVGAFAAIASGLAFGAELWKPWLPWGLLVLAVALYIAGHTSRRTNRG
jgi:hypothetical protein